MSLEGRYETDNVFARILRGELPAAKVHEDEDVLVIMDAFPQAEGHALVIPKVPSRNLLEADPDTLGVLFRHVRRVARAVAAALQPDGVIVTQFNGSAAGQTVFHLHVHIIPRWQGQPLERHAGGMADVEELRALAARIAAKLEPA